MQKRMKLCLWAACCLALAFPIPANSQEQEFQLVFLDENIISTQSRSPRSVFAADLDGDEDMDVLSATEKDDKIAWYNNDGTINPTFEENLISTNADAAFSVFATDLDGDGDQDVLSASAGENKIAWYENDGKINPTFEEQLISTNANGARSVFAADLDGDGDIDVLSASKHDDKIAWYKNDGGINPTFEEHVISRNADFTHSVFAADLDGDGDMDVLSASWYDNKIAWYKNDGEPDPTFQENVISTNANAASSVFATDLDGDGDMDVLSSSLGDDKIAWYENTALLLSRIPAFTNEKHFHLSGILHATDTLLMVSINDVTRQYREMGGFDAEFELMEGQNDLIITAKDAVSGVLLWEINRMVILDTHPPKLIISEPIPEDFVYSQVVAVRGSYEDSSPGILLINGFEYKVHSDININLRDLPPGEIRLTIIAEDLAGNRSEEIVIDFLHESIPDMFSGSFNLRYDDGIYKIRNENSPATHLVRFSVPELMTGTAFLQVNRISWYAGDGPIEDAKVVIRKEVGSFGLENNLLVQDVVDPATNTMIKVSLLDRPEPFLVAPGQDFFAGVYGKKISLGVDPYKRLYLAEYRRYDNTVYICPPTFAGNYSSFILVFEGWAQRNYLFNQNNLFFPCDLRIGYYYFYSYNTIAPSYLVYTGMPSNWVIRATLAGVSSPELQPTLSTADLFLFSHLWNTLPPGQNETAFEQFQQINLVGDGVIDELDLLDWMEVNRDFQTVSGAGG